MIPYSRQQVTENDIKEVIKVLKSDYLTQGDVVPRFEDAISKVTNAKFTTAVNSATSALHISCIALGLKEKDYLWTSANSFVASANCGAYCGANIDLIDIDKFDWNISIQILEKKLKLAKKNNTLPKIIVTVHFSGQPTLQEKIYELSKKYKFKIIEDASHSLGASRHNIKVGSCKWSDVTVFSFHPVKIITSGEGGAITTNSKKIDTILKSLRNHGIIRDKKSLINKNSGPWYFEQTSLGLNYRMTDIHAALGLSQIKRLDYIIKNRNRIANIYGTLLSELPISPVTINKGNISSYHLYPIVLNNKKDINNHKKIFQFLRKSKINVGLHYIPIYRHPFYKKYKFQIRQFKNTEKYYSSAMSLPIFVQITEKEIIHVCSAIKKSLSTKFNG